MGYVLKKLKFKKVRERKDGWDDTWAQAAAGFVFKAMKAMGRQHRGQSGYLQSDTFTAYLFRPNNTLTGRYGRKKRKEKKEQAKLETQEQK